MNPAFEEMTGLREESAIGKTVLELLPETEREWIDKYGLVALTGEILRFENSHAGLGKHFRGRCFQAASRSVCLRGSGYHGA